MKNEFDILNQQLHNSNNMMDFMIDNHNEDNIGGNSLRRIRTSVNMNENNNNNLYNLNNENENEEITLAMIFKNENQNENENENETNSVHDDFEFNANKEYEMDPHAKHKENMETMENVKTNEQRDNELKDNEHNNKNEKEKEMDNNNMLNIVQTYLTDIENMIKTNNQNTVQIEKLRNIIFQLIKQQALNHERSQNEITNLKNANNEMRKEYFKMRKTMNEKMKKLCFELYKREYKTYCGVKEIWSESVNKTWTYTWHKFLPF